MLPQMLPVVAGLPMTQLSMTHRPIRNSDRRAKRPTSSASVVQVPRWIFDVWTLIMRILSLITLGWAHLKALSVFVFILFFIFIPQWILNTMRLSKFTFSLPISLSSGNHSLWCRFNQNILKKDKWVGSCLLMPIQIITLAPTSLLKNGTRESTVPTVLNNTVTHSPLWIKL